MFAAGFAYLILTGIPLFYIMGFMLGFILTIVDYIWMQTIHSMPAFHYFGVVATTHQAWAPKSNTDGSPLCSSIIYSLKNMFNPYTNDNYFTSIGINLLLLPLSLGMAVVSKAITGLFLFMLLLFAAYFCALLITRSEDENTSFFGARQAYPMFIAAFSMNACGFVMAANAGNGYLVLIYSIAWLLYLLHQIYRLLDHHFHYRVDEKRLHQHRKDPENYRKVVREYLKSLPKPAVVLGIHLIMGIPLNFFAFGPELRLVEIRVKVDDQRLLDLIDGYGVTHVIRTPHDYAFDRRCTVLADNLSPELSSRLVPEKVSNDVTVFHVQPNPNKL
ncbi:MAG: hypothetical protein HQK65_17535 [Desulfamplus sp.]|nr:hypothetical protein [Desulfamplus sp.]